MLVTMPKHIALAQLRKQTVFLPLRQSRIARRSET